MTVVAHLDAAESAGSKFHAARLELRPRVVVEVRDLVAFAPRLGLSLTSPAVHPRTLATTRNDGEIVAISGGNRRHDLADSRRSESRFCSPRHYEALGT